MAGPGQFWMQLTKPFRTQANTLAAGETVIVDARGHWKLGLMAGAGATLVVHRVDSYKQSVVGTPDAGTERDVTVPAAGAEGAIEVDWPFYHITVTGGDAYYALI